MKKTSICKVNSGFGAEFTLKNINRNLNWKIFAKLLKPIMDI